MVERFETQIPCEATAAQTVQQRIVSRLEQLDFPGREVFRVRLSLEEALFAAMMLGRCRNQRIRIVGEIDCELQTASIDATLI